MKYNKSSELLTRPPAAQNEKELELDAKAQYLIVSRLEEHIMANLTTCRNTHEIWNKLLSIYEQDSSVSKHLLHQQFYSLSFDGTVTKFLSQIEELRSRLKAKGEELSDNMVITKVLMSLPQDYKHFVSAWESVAEESQTFNELSARLYIEETRLTTSDSNTEALAANTSGHNMKCFKCNKPGHFARNCRNIEQLICHFCHKKGHKMEKCFHRLFKSKGQDSTNAFVSSTEEDLEEEAYAGASSSNSWILDSGASEHMCHERSSFSNFSDTSAQRKVRIGDGSMLDVLGTGTISVQAWNGQMWIDTTINNVLFVPNLKVNLFSAAKCMDKGFHMNSDKNYYHILDKDNKIKAIAKRSGKLYTLIFRNDSQVESCNIADISDWHIRFAHQNFPHVKSFLDNRNIKYTTKNTFCNECLLGKQHRVSYKASSSRVNSITELIHADLCGPIEVTSIGGSRYFLLLTDDFSGYKFVFFLKNKNEVFKCLENFIKLIQNQTDKMIKILRTDNGLEFCNSDIKKLLERCGILHQRSVVYTPQQNGRAERANRTVMEAARTLIANMPKKFWAEAVNTAVFTLNRCGASPAGNKSPYELWTGKTYDVSFLQTFGQKVAVHIPKQKRLKLDAKCKFGIFVGYDSEVKGYRVLFNDNKVETVRDVVFIPESKILLQKQVSGQSLNTCQEDEVCESQEEDIVSLNSPREGDKCRGSESDRRESQENTRERTESEVRKERQNIIGISEKESESHAKENKCTENDNENKYERVLRDRSYLKAPARFEDYEEIDYAFIGEFDEPISYKQAMDSQDSEKWCGAIKQEIEALEENGTWDIVNDYKGKVIDTKWVFKKKKNTEGKVQIYKARLVARGFQQDCVSYEEVYAPVTSLAIVRCLVSIAAYFGWQLHHIDICSAFLHSKIEEDIYIYLPEGHKESRKIGKLNKAIYGLKKAPKYWYNTFNNFLTGKGFVRSKTDMCLYTNITGLNKTYLLLYVDDILVTSSDTKYISYLKTEMAACFKTKDLGLVSQYLGVKIIHGDGYISMDQSVYLTEVLNKFNMLDCKSVSVPLEHNFDLNLLSRCKSENCELENRCRKAIGCIMYAMIGTRFDLCIAINILSRYQTFASEYLWKCLKHVMRYIKGTLDLKLIFRRANSCNVLQAYVDADWAGDTTSRKSTSGYCVMLFDNLVLWCSKKQSCVALSSTEAEYIALSQCVADCCWLTNIISEMKIVSEDKLCVHVFEDNQSAICAASNSEQPKRLKHIDIKYHFVQEKVCNGNIKLSYVCSENQLADFLTKPLSKTRFEKLRKCIGLHK